MSFDVIDGQNYKTMTVDDINGDGRDEVAYVKISEAERVRRNIYEGDHSGFIRFYSDDDHYVEVDATFNHRDAHGKAPAHTSLRDVNLSTENLYFYDKNKDRFKVSDQVTTVDGSFVVAGVKWQRSFWGSFAKVELEKNGVLFEDKHKNNLKKFDFIP